jgi:hypothetical protein
MQRNEGENYRKTNYCLFVKLMSWQRHLLFSTWVDLYYMNYLNVVLRREPFHTTMQLYSQLTPHTWAPNRDFFTRILTEIKTKGAVQYLGKMATVMKYDAKASPLCLTIGAIVMPVFFLYFFN